MKIDRLLIAIFIIGFVLRVTSLGSLPAGFTPDEASFGYDAYSLIETRRDQWGNSFPLVLKSFGDGKMPLYSYLTVPSIAIFGLTEFAVRLPNALLASLAVLVVYALVMQTIKKRHVALLAALLLAISPWHIPLSRGAFEANLTTFLMPLGIYLFLKGVSERKYLPISAIIFGLNMFSYHSARLVTPLILIYFVYIYKNKISIKNTQTKVAFVIVFLFILLVGFTYLFGAGSRLASSSIFSLSGNIFNERFLAVRAGEPDIIARLFNNRLTYVASTLMGNYFQYFSPRFYFSQGPGEGTYGMIPGFGVLYLFELPFLAAAIWGIVTKRIREIGWLLFWIAIAPIPAALAVGPGYAANRAIIMLPAMTILSAIGGITLFEQIKKKIKLSKLHLYIITGSVIVCSFAFFFEDYFFHQKIKEANSMIYGVSSVMEYVSPVEDQYREIIVSKKISEPHIFVAFYTRINPDLYQDTTSAWQFELLNLQWVDQLPEYYLAKYTFKTIDWVADSQRENTLLVGVPNDFPPETQFLTTVYYPNGNPAYHLVDTSTMKFAGSF